MRILFCGDIVGRSGRRVVEKQIPLLRKKWDLDAVIVNGENAAHGFGITGEFCQDLYRCGVDVITTGNHVWDQKDFVRYIAKDPRVLRPLNYPPQTPGRGIVTFSLQDGRRLTVINILGVLFMQPMDDPFRCIQETLEYHQLKKTTEALVIDFHADATSEKNAFGHFVDGRASLVVGTHSHIPTADARILSKGTAFQTDAGMCGDYDSVIGMGKGPSLHRFTQKTPGEKMEPAEGPATLCGVYVETNDQTGLAIAIHPVRIGPHLQPALVK